jgi:hypothetical protein
MMPRPTQTSGPGFGWRSLLRPFRSSRPGTMPAGLVLLVVVGALFLALLGNADSTLRKSEGKPNNAQWRKDVAKQVASVSDFLHLTGPRRGIDDAMGRSDAKGPSLDELEAQRAAQLAAAGTSTDGSTEPASLKPTIRAPTAADPLRIWIGGDSVSQVLGQQVAKASEATGLFTATLDGRVSTGLAVPTYFNWPAHLANDVVPLNGTNQYDVMVTMFGNNDGQNIQLDNGAVLQRFSPEWYAEYQSRVGKTMDLLRSPTNDRVVMWCGPPPMGPNSKVHGMDRISYIGWQEAQKRPWVHFVDTWAFFSDANLQFQHSLPMASGQVRGLRQKDDVHFSDIGGARLAWVILDDLKAYVDLSASKIQPNPNDIAPPDIKERTDVSQNMPGAV